MSATETIPAAAPDADVIQFVEPLGRDWSLLRRIGFRFVFAYLVLYSFPFPIGVIPGTDWLEKRYSALWNVLVPWVGKHILHLSDPVATGSNGSGDRMFNYVLLLCSAVLAGAITIVWSLVAPRQKSHPKLLAWLRIYVRFVLGYTLLSYGMSKVIKTQFPFPSLSRLLQPYGESSPMGLLWTFMGYSTSYTVFAGASEAIAGLLLFVRRSATLGALVGAAVMTNIVMLNFSYDVPVKLYSLHLLLMCVFVMLPDLRRLTYVLVLNRPTESMHVDRPFTKRWARRSASVLALLFVGWSLFSMTVSRLGRQRTYGERAPLHHLYGIYEAEEFIRNQEAVPPLITESRRWRKVWFGKAGTFGIRYMDDSARTFRIEDDLAKRTVTLKPGNQSGGESVFIWTRLANDQLLLEGWSGGDTITARLRRVDESKLLLVNRGFHWINDVPFNR